MDNDEYLAGISQSVSVDSADTIASGDATQVGSDIPETNVRKVWRIEITSDAAQKLEILLGDSVDEDRATVRKYELVANGQVILESKPSKPILILRPQRAAGGTTVTYDRMGVAHETSACECNFTYYED